METTVSDKFNYRAYKALHGLLILTLLWVVFVFESLVSAVNVWTITDTYNHCFLVLPIVFYLIYANRAKCLETRVEFLGWWSFLPLIGIMFVWMLGFVGGLDVLTHIAAFSLLPSIWVVVVGWRIAAILWFPLIFVMFSVPIGEELIPLFQDITATASVKLLAISGVPVYRDGLFIQIPEGRFLVAEACSGVRFFISTVMLGALYAYIMFKTTYKRILFGLFSVVMPIVANVFRAYGIMMIGHLSDMKHAAGADHLIYGWFFFALVTGLLILTAYYFKEPETVRAEIQSVDSSWQRSLPKLPFYLLVLCLVIFTAWKVGSGALANQKYDIEIFGSEPNFSEEFMSPDWQPYFPRASIAVKKKLAHDQYHIGLLVQAYLNPQPDQELISWENRVYDPDDWTIKQSETRVVNGIEYHHVYIVTSVGQTQSIAFWYDVPGYAGSSKLKTKVQQSFNILFGRGGDGLIVMLASRQGSFEENSRLLEQAIVQYSGDLQGISPW